MAPKTLLRTAVAAALLATGLAAQAGTVTFKAWQYSNGNGVNVSTPSYNGQGGAFKIELSGFGGSFEGAFEAYCVELTEFINWNIAYSTYNIVAADTYFLGKGKPLVAGKLTNLISYASDMPSSASAGYKDDQSTALQLAIWNTVYDTDSTLTSGGPGTFSEGSATAFRSTTSSFMGANDLLAGAGTASGYTLYVLQSVGTPGQQDQLIWLRNQVPEPTSLALVALALGGAGFASRRRS